MKIGEIIRNKRMAAGLTRLDIANRLNLGYTTGEFLSQIENGKKDCPNYVLGALFVILNFSVKEQNDIIQYLADQHKSAILIDVLKGQNGITGY